MMNNQQNFNTEAKEKRPDVVELSVGDSSYLLVTPNADTDYIQKKLHNEHTPYEFEMLKDMQNRLSVDDLVIDVGANVGNHTLYLASVVGCEVIAIEPNETLAEAIIESAALNGLADRVHVEKVAAALSEGYGRFVREIQENLGAQSVELGEGNIRVMPLDSLLLPKPVKVIKVDVEGMELLVLQGAETLLRNDRPMLYVECQTDSDFRSVVNWLDTLNYGYWDTFNATPTHLFLPNEQVDIQRRVSRLQFKEVLGSYQENQKLANLRAKLDNANKKYREVNERYAQLKEQLRKEENARKVATEKFVMLQAQLETAVQALKNEQDARQKEVAELTAAVKADLIATYEAQKQINKIKPTLEAATQALKEEQVLLEEATLEKIIEEKTAELKSIKQSLERANQKYREATGVQIPALKLQITSLQKQLAKVTAERLSIEKRLIKTRASLTYQLGYQIKMAATSVRGFVRLPLALWRIYKQAKKRRGISQKKIVETDQNRPSQHKKKFLRPQINPQVTPALIKEENQSQVKALQVQGNRTTIKVACIMDDFSFGCYQPECRLHQLTPDNWQAELESFQPEILFIESAWRGKDGLWGGKVGHKSSELQDIVRWCKDRSIPTVFWNKEDPVHFQTFLNTAKLFDYVFTTDIDCIHRYKAALGHERVYLLPFACQPAVHNPIELYRRKDAISFAGAYYVRYPERTRDLESFLQALPEFRPVEIYDRNYGKDDPNYQFPAEYQPYIVGTLPFDKIDIAYKGYQYAINLNSIKQSQSMFARRVFELLASNTITISNFSRGLRLMFGDLVITSDNGNQLVQRLRNVVDNPEKVGKFRLAALRKVMQKHTYQQRLHYILAKVRGKAIEKSFPEIAVLAKATNQAEADRLTEQFLAQTHPTISMTLVTTDNVRKIDDERVQYITENEVADTQVSDVARGATWLTCMCAKDYYGPNYLLDIALATHYSCAELIGKAAYYEVADKNIQLQQVDATYRPIATLPARRSAIRTELVSTEALHQWLDNLYAYEHECAKGLAIDPYNYCCNVGDIALEQVKAVVDDLPDLDLGLSIEQLQSLAESIQPASKSNGEVLLGPNKLAKLFAKCKSKKIKVTPTDTAMVLRSKLGDGKHEYLYATEDLEPTVLVNGRELKCYLDTTPGLSVSLVILFLDAQKQRINHVIFQANRNGTTEIPPETTWLRLGLRVLSGGETEIKGIVVGHRDLQPAEVIGKAEYLLLTNNYPAYHDLYRNGFVHSRVKAYAERGVKVDVFRLRNNEPLNANEFEDIDVLTGDAAALDKMISSGRYKSVLVHFLSPEMWQVLEQHIDNVRVVVWLHGAEIHPWYRRAYNYTTDAERDLAKIESDKRMGFWKTILNPMPANLHLIFVSQSFANEVFEDLGFDIPETQYSVIHNPINTDKFAYKEKPAEQRKKILSIRPFASRQYANDLSVQAILELSKNHFFNELEFKIIGDGKLFDETIAPLRQFNNVSIEQRFLTHSEIAALHKEYGVFLCPTRWDSQGVSRDEAMSSGLVPVTNAIAAIPEFVDQTSGVLAPPEDANALAEGIMALYKNPDKFVSMSRAASERVRCQSGAKKIIEQELLIIQSSSIMPTVTKQGLNR
ncbi:FkbM family methyltransferase [Peptococcaceae bacterium 1198_IL3148]